MPPSIPDRRRPLSSPGEVPPDAGRSPGRLRAGDLPPLPVAGGRAYVCGSAGFADAVTELIMAAGMPAADIRVERFGPTA